ncbi:hypothetical protein DRQ07_10320, partial [candidate division KSB1 bacterium]
MFYNNDMKSKLIISFITTLLIQFSSATFLTAGEYKDALKRVEIKYNEKDKNVRSIYIAGNFNDWSAEKDELI